MPKPGDIIDCREWTGKPYRSKQIKIGEFVITDIDTFQIDATGWMFLRKIGLNSGEEWVMAQRDGFKDADEMLEWFEREHGFPFEGVLIRWD